ncbi:hypothetical protein CJU78_18235 [Pseudomonas fragi]|nr:hypothetical protein CJU78_18235 [Pseudomonas fragi]
MPRHGAGFGLADLAGFWALSSHAANVPPQHAARHWQHSRINAMSRIALSCTQRARREILPLDLALYHAARDYPGGAAAIAATTGRNPTTLQHKLSPTHPSHTVNVQEFAEILELTKDRRILDAVHALVGDTIWQELAEAYTDDMPETLTTGLAVYFRQVADLADTWAKSIGDGVVNDRELAEIRLQVFRGIQGLLGMFNRACYVNSTTRGADRG